MPKNYLKSISTIRVISILAVLLIHTTTRTIEATNNDIVSYPFTLFLNQISRFAVPLFFLISGLVLELNYPNHTSYISYLKKRVSKIFLPYVFWSLIYYFFIYPENIDSIPKMLANGSGSYQLYFIPSLAIFYLVFPLLHKLYSLISNRFIFISLGVLQFWLLYKDYYVKIFDFSDPIRIVTLSFFAFILGMASAKNKDWILTLVGKFKYLFLVSSILSAIYIFVEGRNNFIYTSEYLSFYSQWRPSVLIYTILLFGLLFYAFDKSERQFGFIEKISKLSYLVFFIHVIVLEKVWSLAGISLFNSIGENTFGKMIFDPLFFTTVTVVSFGSAFLFHKIPHLSKIIG